MLDKKEMPLYDARSAIANLERHIVDHLISIMEFHHMMVKSKILSGYCGIKIIEKRGHVLHQRKIVTN